jgi:hypothetical protein
MRYEKLQKYRRINHKYAEKLKKSEFGMRELRRNTNKW